jgi:hypothetical protein
VHGVVEVERGERAVREEHEAERAERGEHRPDGADALQPRERGLHRDRRRVLVDQELAEHVLLLVLPSRRLLDEERGHREQGDGDAEHEPGPAPAFDAPRQLGDPARQNRAGEGQAVADHVVERRHACPHADRVVVGDQRPVHGDRVRLRDTRREAGPEQHERVDREAREEHEEPEEEARETDDRDPLHPVGEPPHRDRTEHEERGRRGADEDDRPLADAERLADLRGEDVDRRAFQLVERVERGEDEEHEGAALGDAFAHRHRRRVDPREQVVGEDHLLPPARLRGLARFLLIEDRGREIGGTAGALLAKLLHFPRLPPAQPRQRSADRNRN